MKSRYINTCKRCFSFSFYPPSSEPGRCRPGSSFLFDPGYLLPLDHEPFIDHLVHVIVATEPFAELTSFHDRFQEICQLVRLVVLVQPLGDTGGGAVGEDAVHAPSGPVQVGLSLGVLRLAGHLLGPPGVAQHPELGVHPPKRPVPLLEVWGGGVENAVLDIMGGGPAHGKPGESADVEYLAPHQVEDMRPHHVDPAAVPFLLRIDVE